MSPEESLETIDRLRDEWSAIKAYHDRALCLGILARFKRRLMTDPSFKARVEARWRFPSC